MMHHQRLDLEAERGRLAREAAVFLRQITVYQGVPEPLRDQARDLAQRINTVERQLGSLGDQQP
jgi:hypothetical protein